MLQQLYWIYIKTNILKKRTIPSPCNENFQRNYVSIWCQIERVSEGWKTMNICPCVCVNYMGLCQLCMVNISPPNPILEQANVIWLFYLNCPSCWNCSINGCLHWEKYRFVMTILDPTENYFHIDNKRTLLITIKQVITSVQFCYNLFYVCANKLYDC